VPAPRVDGVTEFPLVVVALGGTAARSAPADEVTFCEPDELRVETTPLSRAPMEFPLITAAQHAGFLDSSQHVLAWRDAAGVGLPAASGVGPMRTPAHARGPIEAVILRRGSTRVMRHEAVPADLLVWATASATRPIPLDVGPARTLLSQQLSVHAVDGIQPGLYHRAGDVLRAHRHLAAAEARAIAAHLCLDQALGGDSAYTVFVCTRLHDRADRVPRDVRGDRLTEFSERLAAGEVT